MAPPSGPPRFFKSAMVDFKSELYSGQKGNSAILSCTSSPLSLRLSIVFLSLPIATIPCLPIALAAAPVKVAKSMTNSGSYFFA